MSLTNSIFVNQIGYYFSLIFIVIRFYLTKENPFHKTGLEYAILFYIVAEILSTLFSIDPAYSFRNLMKRFFLIPILYTFVYSAKDFESAKRFAIVYLGAALTTMFVYLGLSYNYFINNFYQLYESGPSTFQYPITSSELMSFSLVFLFTFLIHEKMQKKYRFIVFLLFIINLLALLATYKRTGWMGATAGILFVIILGRKWLLLVPVLLLLMASAFIEKNISEIRIYDYKPNELVPKFKMNTDGRAYSILPEGDDYYVSDFENGLTKFKGSQVLDKYNLGSPVVDFRKWRENYYVANLIDTRFILMTKDSVNKLKSVSEFITPGFTREWCVANGFIYVIDSDSGITVFRNPVNLKDKISFTKEIGVDNEKIFVDSSFVVLFSKSKQLTVISLRNSLPDKLMIKEKLTGKSDLIFYKDSKLIISEGDTLRLYTIESDRIIAADLNDKMSGAVRAIESENKLFIVTAKEAIFELEFPLKNKFITKSKFNLGFLPQSITSSNGSLFVTKVKRSRLLSAIDPYTPSNFSRFALWRAGLKIFMDYPIVGVGDIDLAELYKQYKRNFDKEIQGHLHNNYIHLLVTLGLFGFASVMFLLISIFIIHLKNYSILKNEPFAASYALGAAGAFVAFLVAGLTEWNFGDHEIITMIWFMLALSIAFARYHKTKIS